MNQEDQNVTLMGLAGIVARQLNAGAVDGTLIRKLLEAVGSTCASYKINPEFFWEAGYIGISPQPLAPEDEFPGEVTTVRLPK